MSHLDNVSFVSHKVDWKWHFGVRIEGSPAPCAARRGCTLSVKEAAPKCSPLGLVTHRKQAAVTSIPPGFDLIQCWRPCES